MTVEQQGHITRALTNAYEEDRLHPLYTIVGPLMEGLDVARWIDEHLVRIRLFAPLNRTPDWLGVFDSAEGPTVICVADDSSIPPEVIGRSVRFDLRATA